MNPRILIGCPTAENKAYCLKDYANGIKNLTYKNFDVLIVDNSKTDDYYKEIKKYFSVVKAKYHELARDRIIESRNILRAKCLEGNYDYFLSLEQDVIPPVDIIQRLLENERAIVSALYFYLGDDNKTLLPMAWIHYKGEYARRLVEEEVYEPGVFEVITAGLGCMLIKRDVLEKVKFRYVKEEPGFDDIWFAIDSRKNGFKVYLDTSVKCKHLIKGGTWKGIKK